MPDPVLCLIVVTAMCTRLPTTPPPRALASGTTHYNTTAHKAGRAVGTEWMISAERVSKLTALAGHYGRLEELTVRSVPDEAAGGRDGQGSDGSHRDHENDQTDKRGRFRTLLARTEGGEEGGNEPTRASTP